MANPTYTATAVANAPLGPLPQKYTYVGPSFVGPLTTNQTRVQVPQGSSTNVVMGYYDNYTFIGTFLGSIIPKIGFVEIEPLGWFEDKISPYYFSNASTDRPKMIHNARFIYSYLRKKGWEKEPIWALLANMESEGGMNPAAWQNGIAVPYPYNTRNNTTPPLWGGYGQMQWDLSGQYLMDNFENPPGVYSGFYKNSNHPGNCHTCIICQLERIQFEDNLPSQQKGWQWANNSTRRKAADVAGAPFNPAETFTDFWKNKNRHTVEELTKMWCIYYECPQPVLNAGNNPNNAGHVTALKTHLNERVNRAVGTGSANYPGWKNICNW